MSSRRLTIIVLAAILAFSTAVAAAPPTINPDEALKALGKPMLSVRPEEEEFSLVIEEVNTTGAKDWRPGALIIRLDSAASVSSLDSGIGLAISKIGGSIERKLDMRNMAEGAIASSDATLHFVFAKFSEDADVFALAKEVAKIPGVLYAEPDYRMYPDAVVLPPTDPGYTSGRQYYLNNDGASPYYTNATTTLYGTAGSDLKAAAGWEFANNDFGLDCSSVVVGIIDQGVAFWHADLAANMWVNEEEFEGTEGIDDDGNGYIDDVYGYNFYHNLGINNYASGYKPAQANDYHGTHVAGTISAEWNGVGAAGATRNAKIMSLKFLDEGGGYTSDAIRALEYAALMGADLTSNSWGGGEPEQSLSDAIKASGMLFIAAAGNDGNNNDFFGHYPSSYANPSSPYYCENIITVAATDANDNLVSFSNYGSESVHIAAAGFYVYAPYPVFDGVDYLSYNAWMSGTSMATPQVSAVVAMLIAQDKMHAAYSIPQYDDPDPAGDWDTVKEIVLNSAEKKAQLEGYVTTGGRVSMYGALTMQRLASASSITVTPGFANTIPASINVSVTIDSGDAKASSIVGIEHRWELYLAEAYYQRESTGITATGSSATLTATDFGSYEVKYEMYDQVNDTVITTSYKRVLVVPEYAVLLVTDDQWYGYEDMSFMDWAAFYMYGIPVFVISPPVDIPYDIPNVVFWSTTYTTAGVINEEDAQWLIGYLKYGGGRLLLASYELLNMVDGYYGESGLSEETAEELLDLLKIEDYLTDYTYMRTGTLPLYETPVAVEGDSIIWANGLEIDLDYGLWAAMMPNYGDVVTSFGNGAYPILLSEFGGKIDEPERAALGLSYAGEDYRLIFLGAPLEAMQGTDFYTYLIGGPWSDDIYNFLDLVWYSWEFLLGDGPDRLVGWLENPVAEGTYSNPINVEWDIMDSEDTIHEAKLWYRTASDSYWEPITLFVPGEEFGYMWDFAHTLVGDGYEVKLEITDANDNSRVAYDFEAPFVIWPASPTEGARTGVDRENEEIIFYVNALKPGTLYVYDLSGILLFSEEVPEGMSEITWEMMVNGLRIARGLYAFRVVYNDGSASKTGRFLVNF